MTIALRGLRAAITFLTRVPVGGFPYSDAEWRWAAGWFPAVGLLVGCACAAVDLLLLPAGPWPAAIASVIAGLLLTGAFHEDGLADTADAMGGAYTRERLLEILKDSRVGTFGAAALTMALLLRVACLAALGPAAPAVIVVVHACSRVPPLWLMRALPYVTRDDAARSRLVARPGDPQVLLATATGALVLLAAVGLGALSSGQALALTGVGIGAAIVCGWRFVARAGGLTGDFLGATQQVVEGLGLLALLRVAAA
ncbi:MAG TPA: adenosylcobinamide-GDP ribazoletransferase [Nannocystis sp.]